MKNVYILNLLFLNQKFCHFIRDRTKFIKLQERTRNLNESYKIKKIKINYTYLNSQKKSSDLIIRFKKDLDKTFPDLESLSVQNV